jgi:hypothetical protein
MRKGVFGGGLQKRYRGVLDAVEIVKFHVKSKSYNDFLFGILIHSS